MNLRLIARRLPNLLEEVLTCKYRDDLLPLLVTTHAQLRAKVAIAEDPVTLITMIFTILALIISGFAGFNGIAYDRNGTSGSTSQATLLCAALAAEVQASRSRVTMPGAPICDGGGELDTVWRWLRAWCLVVGRIGVLFVLLTGAWLLCAVPTAAAVSALLSAFGVVDHRDWLTTVFWLTGSHAFGSLGFAWCFVRGIRSLRRL